MRIVVNQAQKRSSCSLVVLPKQRPTLASGDLKYGFGGIGKYS